MSGLLTLSYQTSNGWGQCCLSLGHFEVGCAACHVCATIMYTALQSSAREFLQSLTIWFLAYQSVLLYPEVPDQKLEADCQACEASGSDGCAAT